MAISPAQLLDHAKQIGDVDELHMRTAIGRAYYGVYHAARIFHDGLASPGRLPVKSMGVHETLYHQLTNPTLSSCDDIGILSRKIGFKAKEVKKSREIADYKIDETVSKPVVDYALKVAEETILMALQSTASDA